MDSELDIKAERLTIDYDGKFVPKACCTIDRYGKADDCDGCQEICDNVCRESPSLTDTCSDCPIQKCFNKLGEFENMIEDGTLINVPYKIGDVVYHVLKHHKHKPEIVRGHIKEVIIGRYNNSVCVDFDYISKLFDVAFFGDILFLTEEAAKAEIDKCIIANRG